MEAVVIQFSQEQAAVFFLENFTKAVKQPAWYNHNFSHFDLLLNHMLLDIVPVEWRRDWHFS